MSAVDPSLARALAAGTYAVDARAVADAILRRARTRGCSAVLEAAQRHERPIGAAQPDTCAGRDRP